MTKKTLLAWAALFVGAVAVMAWRSGDGPSVLLLLAALACPLMHVFMHRGHSHGAHGGTVKPSPDQGTDAPRSGP